MGIRSDVFVALKKEIVEKLPAEHDKTLREKYGAEVLVHAKGRAYFMSYVKWYVDDYPELEALYTWLGENASAKEFLIVEACLDYPENTDGDAGDWYDNPWGACRYVRTGIEFEEGAEMNRKGYMVQSTAWDYNDEYYSSFDGAEINHGKVYSTKEAAQAKADEFNFTFASQVAGDLTAWSYGERPGALLDGLAEKIRVEFGRRVFKKDLTAKEVQDELDEVYNISEVDDDTLRWLSKNVHAFKSAYVVEVEVES